MVKEATCAGEKKGKAASGDTRKRKKRRSGKSRRTGRPLKLTPALQKRLVKLLEKGNRRSVALRNVGIARTTFYRWMQWGAERKWGMYKDFRDAIKQAESKAEVLYLDCIQKAAKEGKWQAAAWFLERVYPKEWGRAETRTQQLRIDVTKLSDEQLERIAGGEDPLSVLASTGKSGDRSPKAERDL